MVAYGAGAGRAGTLARSRMEKQRDPGMAFDISSRMLWNFAAEASKSNDDNIKVKAREIKRVAEKLLKQLEQEQETNAKLQIELNAVEVFLVTGELEDARTKLDELTTQYADRIGQLEPVEKRYR